MRNRNSKYYIYIIIGILLIGVGYTACKDITPEQKTVTQTVELKLSK